MFQLFTTIKEKSVTKAKIYISHATSSLTSRDENVVKRHQVVTRVVGAVDAVFVEHFHAAIPIIFFKIRDVINIVYTRTCSSYACRIRRITPVR